MKSFQSFDKAEGLIQGAVYKIVIKGEQMSDKRVALVTGASRGIGRAIALRLAGDGFFVVINYSGNTEAAEAVKAEIENNGGEAICIRCDVSSFTDCEAMFRELTENVGAPEVLVNNAGITRDGLLMAMSEKDFDDVIAINLKGAFNCMRFASKLMLKKRYGRIINISSVSGVMGNPGQANYCASKAGIIGLTKSAARELAGKGITVNAIAPGFIESDMTAVLSDKVREAALSQIPKKRFGTPEEIASVAAFLAAEEAGYITGQVLAVDGGMSM